MTMSVQAFCLFIALALMTASIKPFVDCDYVEPHDWVDPGDMLRYDHTSKTMNDYRAPAKVAPKPPNLSEKVAPDSSRPVEGREDQVGETSQPEPDSLKSNDVSTVVDQKSDKHREGIKEPIHCAKSEFHFYNRFIRSLLGHLIPTLDQSSEMEESHFDVLMVIKEAELATLKSYVTPGSKVTINDVDDILTRLIKHVRLHRETSGFEGVTWYEHLLEKARENMSIIFASLAGFLTILLFRQLSPGRAFILAMVILFAAGSVYEGIHMYQKLEAEKFAERHKLGTVPEHCNPEAVNVFRRIGWSFQVNFLGMDDPCKKYYELLMVDTRFQINPLEVATSALGKVFETMAKFGGNSFGLFYSKALEHFGFFEKIIFVAVITSVLIVVVMYMGPAVVFTLPGIIRNARLANQREMVEDVPQPRSPQFDALIQRIPPAAAPAVCSRCNSQQEVPVEREIQQRSSPNRITILSGNKCISIEDVETVVSELPGIHVDAASKSDIKHIEEGPPEHSTEVSNGLPSDEWCE